MKAGFDISRGPNQTYRNVFDDVNLTLSGGQPFSVTLFNSPAPVTLNPPSSSRTPNPKRPTSFPFAHKTRYPSRRPSSWKAKETASSSRPRHPSTSLSDACHAIAVMVPPAAAAPVSKSSRPVAPTAGAMPTPIDLKGIEPAGTPTLDELEELTAKGLLVPVAGVEASSLRSTFDEERGDGRRHEALDILAREPIDCVVLDLEMPGTDGFEVLRRLHQRNIETPVIVYTGTGSYDRCVQAIRLGADRLLLVSLKHVNPEPKIVERERVEAYPKPLFLAGKALNALMLDHTEYDLMRMQRINLILEAGNASFGSRFEEMDCVVFFDDVLVPWERVFVLGDIVGYGADPDAVVALVERLGADGVFLDSSKEGSAEVRAGLDALRPGLSMEGESRLPLARVHDHTMSWAQWFADSPVPGVLRATWFERRHVLHHTRRWNHSHLDELQSAWLNGSGVLAGAAVPLPRRRHGVFAVVATSARRQDLLVVAENYPVALVRERTSLVDQDERVAGLLGQAAFLALNAKESLTSPTMRGKFVRQTFLCQEVPSPPADAEAQRREERTQVCAALERLSQPHRDVVGLHYVEGLSYAQIAASSAIPIVSHGAPSTKRTATTGTRTAAPISR